VTRVACVLAVPQFRVGDPAPTGYLAKHEWATIQMHGGLRQRRCATCGLWRFPQEKCCGKAGK
jgi:hypothetical protein